MRVEGAIFDRKGAAFRCSRRRGKRHLGWMLAISIVGVGVFGPALTDRSIPALVQIRHEVLTLDREFELVRLIQDSNQKQPINRSS
jgi:hypothetical protein